ncbi:MAG: lipocalin family protein [Emcibacteraceae bacterium]|nr:lipocalin family protein [Emcibacteraceae bacterium]
MKIICLMFAAMGISGCASNVSNFAKLETVKNVDLNRYTGDWFEIARIDHWFQKGCVNSQATYNIRSDGDIEVINKCKVVSADGKTKQSIGRAWVVDHKNNSKLKVQFPLSGIKLPFLAGDYWIIELDEDYKFVMIGEESREYLWILSRDKIMPKKTLALLINKAKTNGFHVDKLIYQGF